MNRIRPRSALAGFCAALLALVPVAPAEAQDAAASEGPDTWYTEMMMRKEKSAPRAVHLWSRGAQFRALSIVGGRPVLTIVSGEIYYAVDGLSGKGVGIRRAPEAVAQDAKRGRPFGRELDQLVSAGGESIGTETIGGQTVEIYRLTNSQGRRTIWVDSERTGLPIRIENFDRRTGKTDEINYLGWRRGAPIPDRFFEADPRFEIERLELDQYRERAKKGEVGPVPVLYGRLLHGRPDDD